MRREYFHQEQDPQWKQVGWSRAPRNGREYKLLKEGFPEPKPITTKPYHCRRCDGHTYKVQYRYDRRRNIAYEARYCPACKNADNARSRAHNESKALQQRREYHQKVKASSAVFDEDGIATVKVTWVLTHQAEIVIAVAEGKRFIVEYYGELAYEIGAMQ